MRVHQTSRVPAAAASHPDHKLCSKRQLPVFDLCLNFEFPFVFSVNSSAYRFILQEEMVLVFFFLPPSPTPSRGWPHFYRFPPAIFSTLRSSHMSFYTYFWVPFGRRRALNCEAINDCKWFEHSPGKGDLPHYAASLRTDHQRPWENTLPLEHPPEALSITPCCIPENSRAAPCPGIASPLLVAFSQPALLNVTRIISIINRGRRRSLSSKSP